MTIPGHIHHQPHVNGNRSGPDVWLGVWRKCAFFTISLWGGEPFESAASTHPFAVWKKWLAGEIRVRAYSYIYTGPQPKAHTMWHDMTPLIQPVAVRQAATKLWRWSGKWKHDEGSRSKYQQRVHRQRDQHEVHIMWECRAPEKDSWSGYSCLSGACKLARVNDHYVK